VRRGHKLIFSALKTPRPKMDNLWREVRFERGTRSVSRPPRVRFCREVGKGKQVEEDDEYKERNSGHEFM